MCDRYVYIIYHSDDEISAVWKKFGSKFIEIICEMSELLKIDEGAKFNNQINISQGDPGFEGAENLGNFCLW